MRKAVVAGATMGAVMLAGALFNWVDVSPDGSGPATSPSQISSLPSQARTLSPPNMAEARLTPPLRAPMAQHAVIAALRPVYDPRRMRIGQRFSLTLASENAGPQGHEPPSTADQLSQPGLLALAFHPSVDQEIIVRRDPQRRFTAEVIERLFERRDAYGQGLISTSLYDSAIAAKLPMDVLIRLIQVFSFDVDFQREV
jgi:hypothetical protein